MKQKLGRVAWEYTHNDGHFRGFHYCVGYCPHCNVKQVLSDDGIKEFNKNASYPSLVVSWLWVKISGMFYCFRHIKRLKVRFEIAEEQKTFDTAKPQAYNVCVQGKKMILNNTEQVCGP